MRLFLSYCSLHLGIDERVEPTHQWPRAGIVAKPQWLPWRPFKISRLNQELKLTGEYGLWNKHEVWRSTLLQPRSPKAAREPLMDASIWRYPVVVTYLHLVLDEGKMKLDYILGLKIKDFFGEVFKLGLAKSIHHTWVLIRRYHIRVHKQVVNIWSFIVLLASQKHIYNFFLCIPYREASWRGSTPKRARVEPQLVMTRGRIKSAHLLLDWWIV